MKKKAQAMLDLDLYGNILVNMSKSNIQLKQLH